LARYPQIPDRTRSLLPGSPELYKTKEALEERLHRRVGDGYSGKALQRFEPNMNTHSEATRLARLDAFRAKMNKDIKAQIEKAPRFRGPFVDVSMRDADNQPDVCQSEAD